MNVSLERFLKSERMPMARGTGGLNPDWSNIPTKNMTKLTKDDIRAQIRDIAKQEASATDDKERDDLAKKRQGLFTAYESFGSPDRKTLFDDALDIIRRNAGNLLKKGGETPEQKDVFDFINERDFKKAGFAPGSEETHVPTLRALGMRFDESFDLANNGSVRATSTAQRGVSFEIFSGREQVLNIKRDGSVSHKSTDEEKALKKEITDFYNSVRNEFRGTPATPPPVLSGDSGDTMDFKV
ncbi:MAG: hypothetical protein FWD48_04340 [Oscillospiraceae bacterium]|nr:hypothetical protein [Oscillospiraceae bacterium]